MTIGERIKKRRNELNWSQRELAKRMEYQNHSTITKIEAGKVDIPQSRIKQFAGVLGVSIAYLMGWNEKPKENAEFHAEILMDVELMDALKHYVELDADNKKIVRDLMKKLNKKGS